MPFVFQLSNCQPATKQQHTAPYWHSDCHLRGFHTKLPPCRVKTTLGHWSSTLMRHHWKTVYFQHPQTLHSRGLSAKTSTNPQSPVFPRTWYRRSPSHGHPPCVVISPLHPQVFTITNGGSQLSHFLNPTQPLTEWTQLSQFPAWSLINGSIIYTMQFLTSYMKAPYILRRVALNLFTSERWTDSKILTSE